MSQSTDDLEEKASFRGGQNGKEKWTKPQRSMHYLPFLRKPRLRSGQKSGFRWTKKEMTEVSPLSKKGVLSILHSKRLFY